MYLCTKYTVIHLTGLVKMNQKAHQTQQPKLKSVTAGAFSPKFVERPIKSGNTTVSKTKQHKIP